jgi:hypothetical protein
LRQVIEESLRLSSSTQQLTNNDSEVLTENGGQEFIITLNDSTLPIEEEILEITVGRTDTQ